MKRIQETMGGTLSLLVLGLLVLGLITVFRAQTLTGELSPLPSPTSRPSPLPTPPPTFTKIPPPPTRTPRPSSTPAAPTSTPRPLPTLVVGWQTFVYATTTDGRPAIYRFQVDSAVRRSGPVNKVDTSAWPASRTRVEGLYPSPSGKQVAVAWIYGEGGKFLSILNVNDGSLRPLFDESANIDKRVSFLAWSPDGDDMLVLGDIHNPDLGGKAWLVNVSTRKFRPTDIVQRTAAEQITSASFAPDGKTIVYARNICFGCGSEVWRATLDSTEQQLLFKVPEYRLEQLAWSPDGRHIAFAQWRETEARNFFIGGINSVIAAGELWIVNGMEGDKQRLASALTGYSKQFNFAWSQDGEQIAFVMNDGVEIGERLDELRTNVWVADVSGNKISQQTQFRDAQILVPTWSPSKAMLAFAGNPDPTHKELELWTMRANGEAIRPIDESRDVVINADLTNITFVWLP